MAPSTMTAGAALAVSSFFSMLIVPILSETGMQGPQKRRLKVPHLALAEISGNSRIRTKSLLQKSQAVKMDAKDPFPAGWFGDFSQAESTYTDEGLDAYDSDPKFATKYGRDPSLDPQYKLPQLHAFTPAWFHETPSGGYIDAWQSHYPAITGNFAGNRDVSSNKWRNTPEGWRQDYTPMHSDEQEAGVIHASWFDQSVANYDGFARKMMPTKHDGRRYNSDVMWMWEEKTVNTTLQCSEPGCVATAKLHLYNFTQQDGRLCSLSVNIHPTDYDDEWSREHVEYIKVNGYDVVRQCNPRARGCNSTADAALYPCINSYDLDKLIDTSGSIQIEAKNSQMVDECPHNGNLLDGVAVVTCMIRMKPWIETTPPPTPPPHNLTQYCQDVVKCSTRGCTGTALVPCSPALALNGGTCKLNITVRQTDYDDNLGLPEQIDFFQVEGVNVSNSSIQPGKNPCNEQYNGTSLTDADYWYEAVSGVDITDLMKTSHPLGHVKVTGKISHQVDECGYDGSLLYGLVTITCDPPGDGVHNFTALPVGGLEELPKMLETPDPLPRPAEIPDGTPHAGFLNQPVLLQKSARPHLRIKSQEE